MQTLGARLGFWLVLVMIGAASGGWIMWGQVQEARSAQAEAIAKLVTLGKQLEEVRAQQLRTDATLATRRSQDQRMIQELRELRSELDKAFDHDQESRDWADRCVPPAVAQRMQLPADHRCAAGIPAR